MKKICSQCGEPKYIHEFHRDKGAIDGRKYKCAECTSKTRASRVKGENVPVPDKRITNKCMDRWWV